MVPPARRSKGRPSASDELRKIDAYWRASLYLCLGMLYLKENPLLREPLTVEQTKPRLLGHWGSDAGQSFHLHSLQPLDQQIRSQRNLHLGSRARGASSFV